ncbi:TPA: DNA repair protein RecO [Candidatus Taylorbacteria bacterium]|nr:DNA repair protein RecO [Candidatus Taylorbacteria bacterium]
MSHHVYNTRGIVIETFDVKEANKTYWIFTRELGMIVAAAQGVRLAVSKLRFSLQPLSISEVSLVRGRAGWRVVNAREISNIYWRIKDVPQSVAMSSRVLRLMRRLVTGEEKNEALFDRLTEGLTYLAGGVSGNLPTTKEVMNLEFILLLQVLYTLGYFAPPTELLWCINDPLSPEMIENMSVYRSQAISHINASIKETQL